jgi:DNA excision repair protein ERCC-2
MEFFPFEKVRPEQSKFLADVETAVKEGKSLIAHAPTGIGKTAAVLTPTIEYALENNLTVFFLTSRNSQHHLVMQTLKEMNEKKKLDAVDFVGKKHMCPKMLDLNSSKINFFEFCFDLRKKKNCELFSNCFKKANHSEEANQFANVLLKSGPMKVEDVIVKCRSSFCTYEISTLMAKQANVIVADYFHLFSPGVNEAFLKRTGKEISKSIIIVDEAHNLPDRIRNDLTISINFFILKKAEKQFIDDKKIEIADLLADLRHSLIAFAESKLKNEKEAFIEKQEFISLIENSTQQKYDDFLQSLSDYNSEIKEPEDDDNIKKVITFLTYWRGADKGFTRIISRQKTASGKPFYNLEYGCLDPSVATKEILSSAHSSILMSGTLLPVEMYREVLGMPEDTMLKIYENPFPRKNKLVLVSPDITTKYTQRNEQMYKKIAASSAYMINSINGNSAVFFPSYDLLSKTMFYLTSIPSEKLAPCTPISAPPPWETCCL